MDSRKNILKTNQRSGFNQVFEPHLSPCFEEAVVRGPYVRIPNLKGCGAPAWVTSLASPGMHFQECRSPSSDSTVRVKNLLECREGHNQLLER